MVAEEETDVTTEEEVEVEEEGTEDDREFFESI